MTETALTALPVDQEAAATLGDGQAGRHVGGDEARLLLKGVQLAAQGLQLGDLTVDPCPLGIHELQDLLGIGAALGGEGALDQVLDLGQGQAEETGAAGQTQAADIIGRVQAVTRVGPRGRRDHSLGLVEADGGDGHAALLSDLADGELLVHASSLNPQAT